MSARKIIVIEKADHKGDTKTIYSGVKALSGTDERDQTLFGQTRHNTMKLTIFKSWEKFVPPLKMNTFKFQEKFVPPLQSAFMKPEGEKKRTRVRISNPEELAGVWKDFLTTKFTPTKQAGKSKIGLG